VLLVSSFTVPFVFAQQDAAGSALSSAKQQLVTCYLAAGEAEAAGADVSTLTIELEGAGELFSRAELAYSAGDFEAVIDLASQSSLALNGFLQNADLVRFQAIRQANLDFWFSLVTTIVGSLVVIIGGFLVWWRLKKRFEGLGVDSA
jgi:hypothetical protein